jgi:hypothetical protein
MVQPWHGSAHDVEQQIASPCDGSEQNPFAHWSPAEQGAPTACCGVHAPPLQ